MDRGGLTEEDLCVRGASHSMSTQAPPVVAGTPIGLMSSQWQRRSTRFPLDFGSTGPALEFGYSNAEYLDAYDWAILASNRWLG
jgi:hypothetical protein